VIMKVLCSFLLLTVLGGVLPRLAQAATIEFEAIDLADVVPGDDLWRYRYLLSGFVFNTNEGFTIFASPTLYRSLATPGAPNADWDTPAVAQPSPPPPVGLDSDGFLDELALVNNASLADAFILDFVWLGGPAFPGVQDYETYTLNGGFRVTGVGQTQPLRQAPEPGTVALLAFGGTLIAIRRRRARA